MKGGKQQPTWQNLDRNPAFSPTAATLQLCDLEEITWPL